MTRGKQEMCFDNQWNGLRHWSVIHTLFAETKPQAPQRETIQYVIIAQMGILLTLLDSISWWCYSVVFNILCCVGRSFVKKRKESSRKKLKSCLLFRNNIGILSRAIFSLHANLNCKDRATVVIRIKFIC